MKKKILSILGLLALIAGFALWYLTPKTANDKMALINSMIQGACEADTRPVQPLVTQALEHIHSLHLTPGIALDLGTGCGHETRYLLKQGYEVIAVDHKEGYLTFIKSQKDLEPYRTKLRTIHSRFEDLGWEDIPQVDLVVASYSLTGSLVKDLPKVWQQIVDHIKSGGFFVGELTTAQKSEVLSLLKDFNLVVFKEEPSEIEEKDKATPSSTLYSIIAQKK